MKRKELTKTSMMILNLVSMVYTKIFHRIKGQSEGHLCFHGSIDYNSHTLSIHHIVSHNSCTLTVRIVFVKRL